MLLCRNARLVYVDLKTVSKSLSECKQIKFESTERGLHKIEHRSHQYGSYLRHSEREFSFSGRHKSYREGNVLIVSR